MDSLVESPGRVFLFSMLWKAYGLKILDLTTSWALRAPYGIDCGRFGRVLCCSLASSLYSECAGKDELEVMIERKVLSR